MGVNGGGEFFLQLNVGGCELGTVGLKRAVFFLQLRVSLLQFVMFFIRHLLARPVRLLLRSGSRIGCSFFQLLRLLKDEINHFLVHSGALDFFQVRLAPQLTLNSLLRSDRAPHLFQIRDQLQIVQQSVPSLFLSLGQVSISLHIRAL